MSRLLLIAVVAATCVRCGDDGPKSPSGPTPPGLAMDTLVSFEIAGSTNLTAVGERSQLQVTARFSSGITREITSEVVWRSGNPAIAVISPAGLLTAVAPGRTLVNAQYQARASTREVTVLPTGTFVLKGRVVEPGNLPLLAAKVEIADGPQIGRAAFSDGNGAYELYGVSGQVLIRATKADYMPVTLSASLTSDRILDFELPPNVTPVALAGTYRATFTASSTCFLNLPESVRARTYGAVIRQTSARIDVEFFGAEFAVNPRDNRGKGFSARLRGNSLQFTVGDNYYGYFEDLVEQLDARTYLTINGFSTATATSSEISGILQGTIAVWDAPNGFYGGGKRQTSACRGDHPFIFARQ